MATDVLVSRELKSLQDELSAARTQRARKHRAIGADSPTNRRGAAARAVG
jgi:hypothetical protein